MPPKNSRGIQYFKDAKWTFGSPNVNYGKGKKMSFSNLYHSKLWQTATAKVGNKSSGAIGAVAEKTAEAKVVGNNKDKATTYYNY